MYGHITYEHNVIHRPENRGQGSRSSLRENNNGYKSRSINIGEPRNERRVKSRQKSETNSIPSNDLRENLHSLRDQSKTYL